MKYLRLAILTGGFLFILVFVKIKGVNAIACSPSVNGSTFTVSSSCSFSGTTDGVDYGTGTVNAAILKPISGATITISANQTLATGSINLTSVGSFVLINGGMIKLNTPLYVTDADADGYPANTTLYLSSISGRVRRSSLVSMTLDCNDNSYSASNICCVSAGGACTADNQCCTGSSLVCGTDADGDGQFSNSAGHTGVCANKSYTDCNDGNSSIYSGNGNWYNSATDYNCSGSIEKLYPEWWCNTCHSGTGRQADNDGIAPGTACGASGTWWRTLGWGCWYPSSICPAQTNSSVTQQCH